MHKVLTAKETEEIAEQLRNLRYDSLARIISDLSFKISNDGFEDKCEGRIRLGYQLEALGRKLGIAAGEAFNVWNTCKNFMDDDRFRGCLVGLAIGDALGTTLEFADPKATTFTPIKDMIGGGPFRLPVGYWTDDTSMALCSAFSLVECRGFDAKHHLDTFVKWWKEGLFSSTGTCFDIGNTIRTALTCYQHDGSIGLETQSQSNGALMRLAPVILYGHDKPNFKELIIEATKITHNNLVCIEASILFADKVSQALSGRSKEEIRTSTVIDHQYVTTALQSASTGEFEHLDGSGFVVSALETALEAFFSTNTFEEGALKAVNKGNDSDTTGAIYGQIAGAYYGWKGLTVQWKNKLYMLNEIAVMASNLMNVR